MFKTVCVCELAVDLITVVLDQSVTEIRKTNNLQENGADYYSECQSNFFIGIKTSSTDCVAIKAP